MYYKYCTSYRISVFNIISEQILHFCYFLFLFPPTRSENFNWKTRLSKYLTLTLKTESGEKGAGGDGCRTQHHSWKSSKNNKTNSKLGLGLGTALHGGGSQGEEQEEQELTL